MQPAVSGVHDRSMTSNLHPPADRRAREHDAANRDRYAIRRSLLAMTVELQRLERRSRDFDVREQDTKDAIEQTWLAQHWGQPPLHPPGVGMSTEPDTASSGRRLLATSAAALVVAALSAIAAPVAAAHTIRADRQETPQGTVRDFLSAAVVQHNPNVAAAYL